jgi:hypothetical protein
MANFAATIGTSATVIRAKNSKRIHLWFENLSSGTVFVGDSSSVTTSNGIRLAQNEVMELKHEGGHNKFFYKGDWYGIVASGTSNVQGLELEESKQLI